VIGPVLCLTSELDWLLDSALWLLLDDELLSELELDELLSLLLEIELTELDDMELDEIELELLTL